MLGDVRKYKVRACHVRMRARRPAICTEATFGYRPAVSTCHGARVTRDRLRDRLCEVDSRLLCPFVRPSVGQFVATVCASVRCHGLARRTALTSVVFPPCRLHSAAPPPMKPAVARSSRNCARAGQSVNAHLVLSCT
jgi:hypothetical protein